jgi:[CysO sulfur-carrier protein]-S-L-cysteine hydrolase
VNPGPESVRLPVGIAETIVAHARAEQPNEACGVIVGSADAGSGGVPLRYEPCRNEAASPVRFRIHPDDLLRIALATEAAGQDFWAFVHSHVRSAAVPSRMDIEAAAWWPSALHVLVSLDPAQAALGTGMPSLRVWRIVGEDLFEVAVEPA